MKTILVGCLSVFTLVTAYTAHAETKAPPSLTHDVVTVTANRVEENVLDVPANVTVIDRETLENSGERYIADVLRTQHGFWVHNTSGSSPTGVSIDARGFSNGSGSASRVLVLIDGRVANGVQSSSTDWSSIPLENIERIELVRGPGSTVYGDHAVGGVIQIITKQGAQDPTVSTSHDMGSFGFHSHTISASGTKKNFHYNLFAKRALEDGFRHNSAYDSNNGQARMGLAINQQWSVDTSVGINTYERELPGSINQAGIDNQGRHGRTSTSSDSYEAINRFGFIKADYKHDDTLEGFLQVSIDDVENSYSLTTATNGVFAPVNDETQVEISAQGTYRLELAGLAHRITVGAQSRRGRVTATTLSDFGAPSQQDMRYHRRLYGLSLNDHITLSEKWAIQAGFRYDRTFFAFDRVTVGGFSPGTVAGSMTFSQPSPRLSAIYSIDAAWRVFATAARAYRFPNTNELTGTFGSGPQLTPESARHVELGAKYKKGHYNASLSAYQMTVKEEIFFNSAAFRNENLEETEHRGLEVASDFSITPTLNAFANATYTRVVVTEDDALSGLRMPISPPYSANLGVSWQFHKFVTWHNQLRLASRRKAANDLNQAFRELAGYGTTSTRVVFDYPHAWFDLRVHAGINNLFDREYSDFAAVGGFPQATGFYPSPGRNINAGVTLTKTF